MESLSVLVPLSLNRKGYKSGPLRENGHSLSVFPGIMLQGSGHCMPRKVFTLESLTVRLTLPENPRLLQLQQMTFVHLDLFPLSLFT